MTAQPRAMEKLIVLGTGNASSDNFYNTCFALCGGQTPVLVDAGGGNGIFLQMRKAGLALGDFHHAFLSHCHTDHVLGMVWVLRRIAQLVIAGRYEGTFTLHCHGEASATVHSIADMTLSPPMKRLIGDRIRITAVADGEKGYLGSYPVTFFDIHAKGFLQYGFSLTLKNGERLVFAGDEPLRENGLEVARNADWLLCEAFCLYGERDRFNPYAKHHSTTREASELAESLGVRRLVLWHTEDSHAKDRKKLYTEEARQGFRGFIVVPDDLETICLSS